MPGVSEVLELFCSRLGTSLFVSLVLVSMVVLSSFDRAGVVFDVRLSDCAVVSSASSVAMTTDTFCPCWPSVFTGMVGIVLNEGDVCSSGLRVLVRLFLFAHFFFLFFSRVLLCT